jgi:hypothetical protein
MPSPIAEFSLPTLGAADERLVVAGELEPQLGLSAASSTLHSWHGTVTGSIRPTPTRRT